MQASRRAVTAKSQAGVRPGVERSAEEGDAVDRHVGGRIRMRRVQLGYSQGALANQLGVSFQAVQKYEAGDIRISASRLFEVARILGVAPGFFYDGCRSAIPSEASLEASDRKALDQRETLSLIRGYYAIADERVRTDVLRLIMRLAEPRPEPNLTA